VHDLLKTPLYEMRTLSLAEVMALEKECGEYGVDWDE